MPPHYPLHCLVLSDLCRCVHATTHKEMPYAFNEPGLQNEVAPYTLQDFVAEMEDPKVGIMRCQHKIVHLYTSKGIMHATNNFEDSFVYPQCNRKQ